MYVSIHDLDHNRKEIKVSMVKMRAKGGREEETIMGSR